MNPYPGLRPFQESEAHLFFGRAEQIDELLAELERSRFVAVLGSSGSGKSSLVRAGLLPALHGGFAQRGGSHWHIATMRPGANPIHNLARALAAPEALGPEDPDPVASAAQVEATLRRSGLGLADAAREGPRPGGRRLLIVVDQFEELFRFSAGDPAGPGDASAFVQLLIEATRQDDAVEVILTMRSDFLGDCSQFGDLPETINRGLFLVPRLTRPQLREAITAPAAVGGGAIAPRLVQRLLNDAGANPDVLPVLQHALMRTWDLWAENGSATGPIDLEDYESAGGLAQALSRHADEAYGELPDDRHRRIAELMSKRLTELGPDRRELRRPSPLDEIAAVAEATPDEVRKVIGHFAQPGRSFVTVSADEVVDISHESLIREWRRLRDWVREEAQSRDIYRRLANAAERRERREAALLRNPELQIATNWWNGNRPNQAWADRYDPAFERAAEYLQRSRRATTRRRLIWGGATLAVVTVLVVITVLALNAQREAASQRDLAESRQLAAESDLALTAASPRALPLALAAARTQRTAEAERALRAALLAPIRGGADTGHDGVSSVAFSAGGARIATAGDDGTVRLWDASGEPVGKPIDTGQDISSVAFSPGGDRIATGGEGGRLRLWDASGEPVGKPIDAGQGVSSVTFSPGGARIATGTYDGTVRLWDASGEPVGEPIDTGQGGVSSVAFSPGGARLATGTYDGTLRLWDASGEPVGKPIDTGQNISSVVFSRGGDRIATGGYRGSLRLWDASGRLLGTRNDTGQRGVYSMAFSGDRIATGGGDDSLRLWAASGRSLGKPIDTGQDSVGSVVFSPSGDRIATGGGDGTLRLWDPRRRLFGEPVAAGHLVSSVVFSPGGDRIATAGDDGTMRLWDASGEPVGKPIDTGQGLVSSVAFSPGGARLATGTYDGTLRLWDASGEPVGKPIDIGQNISSVAFSPSGDRIASTEVRIGTTGNYDSTVRLWDASGEPVGKPIAAGHLVSSVVFSPGGARLATGGYGGRLRLWDASGEPVGKPIDTGQGGVSSVAFSPGGARIATGNDDGTLRLWDASGEPVGKPIDTGQGSVSSVAFSGDRIATAGDDGIVRLWDANGEPVGKPIDTGQRYISSVAFSPGGDRIATGGGGTLRLFGKLYSVGFEDLKATAERRVG